MKNILLAALVLFSAVSFSSAEDSWFSMFNGKDLSGWKSNTETEKRPADVFSVKDGELVVNGGRAHLF